METLQFFGTTLVLDGRALHPGDALEIRVFGSWLPGTVAYDRTGWSLLTAEQVRIRLSPGLPARLVPPLPHESGPHLYGHVHGADGGSAHPT